MCCFGCAVCLGAFHRVYEKTMQHFDSTTSNFNGTFLVLPFTKVHRHSNMSCISVYLEPVRRDPNMLVSNIWTVQVLQVCPANKSKDLLPKLCGIAVLSGESASFSRPGPVERLFLGAETISLPGDLERAGVAMNPWTTERCGGICRVSYKSGASS